MGQPGMPGSGFNHREMDGSLNRRIRDLERQVQQVMAANQLATAGISTVENGIVVNGSMAITGTLALPAGIIDNEALTAPVEPATGHTQEYDFSITPTPGEKARVTIPVPIGYTQALVMASATLSAYNSSGADDNLYVHCGIQGVTVGASPGMSVISLYTGAVTASASGLLTGISESIYVAGYASSGAGTWSSTTAGNILNVSVMVIFLR